MLIVNTLNKYPTFQHMLSLKKTLATLALASTVGTLPLSAISMVQLRTFDSGAGGNYRANPNAEFEYVIGNYADGFSTDGTWFGTFCIEFNEYFNNGHNYEVALNNGAVSGGETGAVNGKDIISVGTAFLYEQFARGTLAGFVYGSQSHAAQLQNAIWQLEGEYSGPDNFGTFLSLAQSVANWDQDYTGSAVQVMNLTQNDGASQHQDQLVYLGVAVPDSGSTIALFGIAITGFFLLRRKRK